MYLVLHRYRHLYRQGSPFQKPPCCSLCSEHNFASGSISASRETLIYSAFRQDSIFVEKAPARKPKNAPVARYTALFKPFCSPRAPLYPEGVIGQIFPLGGRSAFIRTQRPRPFQQVRARKQAYKASPYSSPTLGILSSSKFKFIIPYYTKSYENDIFGQFFPIPYVGNKLAFDTLNCCGILPSDTFRYPNSPFSM